MRAPGRDEHPQEREGGGVKGVSNPRKRQGQCFTHELQEVLVDVGVDEVGRVVEDTEHCDDEGEVLKGPFKYYVMSLKAALTVLITH